MSAVRATVMPKGVGHDAAWFGGTVEHGCELL